MQPAARSCEVGYPTGLLRRGASAELGDMWKLPSPSYPDALQDSRLLHQQQRPPSRQGSPAVFQGHWARAARPAPAHGAPSPAEAALPRRHSMSFSPDHRQITPQRSRPTSSPAKQCPPHQTPALAAALRALAGRGGVGPAVPLSGPRKKPYIPRLDLSRLHRR
eukprot:TRINITY_DN20379_c0_g1_i1.p2 TRINITY_DN20379_c0_g1~~TRINITY_DN20379_c0_g1_i1.p2  ORF type:complete len:164 (+),score=29.94 TRINITY_DN20379_c0_g1_i1:86-577(+)